jgi:hypothetical protein
LIGIDQAELAYGLGIEPFNLEYIKVLDFGFVVLVGVEIEIRFLQMPCFLRCGSAAAANDCEYGAHY